jgi:hypothetical protein
MRFPKLDVAGSTPVSRSIFFNNILISTQTMPWPGAPGWPNIWPNMSTLGGAILGVAGRAFGLGLVSDPEPAIPWWDHLGSMRILPKSITHSPLKPITIGI